MIPDPLAAAERSRHKRELLEFAASISDRARDELRRVQAEEVQARRDREPLEWLAQMSEQHERELRELQRLETNARDADERYEQLIEFLDLQEAQWDPAKHPRRGTAPNPGWFATTGGAGAGASSSTSSRATGIGSRSGSSTSVPAARTTAAPKAARFDATQAPTSSPRNKVPAATAVYSGPKEIAAQQVAWPPPVGHHWVPVGVTLHPDIRPFLSDDAVQYAAGAYSGPTNPAHGNRTYGEVAHPKYSAEVRKELKAFIDQRGIEKMTAKDMAEFMELIKSGRGANGKPNAIISSFNGTVKGMVPKGTKPPTTLDEIMAAGAKHMKHSRFKLLAAGAVISGILGEVINQQMKVLEVAANSGHYRRALKALEDGDLSKAHSLLIGDGDSLYHEILGRVGAHAALNFKRAMERVFEMARNQDYR